MTSESAIVKAILAYLNSLPGCLARKRWGGGMGVAGIPISPVASPAIISSSR